MPIENCFEVLEYNYFKIEYSKLNKEELIELKKFLKHTESNINKLINGIDLVLEIDSNEFEIVKEGNYILLYETNDNKEYIVFNQEEFERQFVKNVIYK